MNICILDTNIQKSVEYHCDKHVVKMIVEASQVLSTVQRLQGNEDERLYKKTHINHPVVKWCNSSGSNYFYTYLYFLHLSQEYKRRFNKVHKSYKKLHEVLEPIPKNLPYYTKESFYENYPCVMDDIYKVYFYPKTLDEIVANYRNYYLQAKKNILQYKYSTIPYWVENSNIPLKVKEMV